MASRKVGTESDITQRHVFCTCFHVDVVTSGDTIKYVNRQHSSRVVKNFGNYLQRAGPVLDQRGASVSSF